MATLTTILNPFDPINCREIKEIEVGKPIYAVVAGFYVFNDVVVSLNGHITTDYEYIIQPEDHIGFVAVLGKGGGKNPLAMIAMIALSIAVPIAAPAMLGAMGMVSGTVAFGLASGALSAGMMIAGGMLINTLLPPSSISNSPTQSIESSPTYGWDSVSNQSAEGIALPIVYGKAKLTPPIISQYVESKNNKQYLNIMYALNDGEITAVSDIMINDNPISYYTDVTYDVRLGTNSQALIPAFDNTRVDTSVGAKISTVETIRQTAYNNVSALNIVVSAPSGIYYANDKGGLDSRSVALEIKYKMVGTGIWFTIANTSISGATTSTIRKTFQLDNLSSGQYEISIRRIEAESTSSRTQNKVYFEGFTEIIYDDFTYPTTALLAIRALATDQLSGSMPRITCVVDRGFSTSNPATATRNIIELMGESVNVSKFDEWASWCTGENFECNVVFDSEINVRDALNITGMLGRANVVQIGSEYMPIIDRAETLSIQRFLFTMGNIIRDSFKEDYLPLADRSNVVEVTYFDETLDYEKQSVELYQYKFDESSDSIRKASVTLYGCTTREQALRHGRFLMNKNRYITNTVSFEADVDAIACTTGDIIDVAHDVPQWGYSGRTLSTIADDNVWCYHQSTLVNGIVATPLNTNVIELDRDITLEVGTQYAIAFRLHDDTRVTVAISTTITTTTTLIPVVSTVNISDYDLYSFGQTNRTSKLFRVASITRSSDQRRKISAVEYIHDVYNDNLDNIIIPNVSALEAVSYLNIITDTEVATDGRTINIINLLWSGSAVAWDIYQREAYTTTWKLIGNTQNTFFQIKDVMSGAYEFKVGDKIVSQSISTSVEPLSDVSNLIAYYLNGNMTIKWDTLIERYRSPITYEIRRGVSWENSEVLGRISVNQLQADSAGSYWVKAYYLAPDGSESWSTTATGISITGDTVLKNVVATWDEYATGWIGIKTGVVIDGVNLKLPTGTVSGTYDIPSGHIIALSSAQMCRVSMSYSAGAGTSALFDDIADIDTYPNIDGDATGTWSVRPKLAISQDGTTWGGWQDFAIGDYVGKAFKARLEVTSTELDITVLVDGFKFTVDMPDRVDKGTLPTVTGGSTVTYVTPFQTKPNTQITIVNAMAGDDVSLSSESKDGFTVQVLNSGIGVVRTINYLSQGY